MAELSGAELTLLEGLPLFRGAPEGLPGRAAADPRCRRLERGKGEAVYTPSQFSHSLGVVLAGRVQVTKGDFSVNTLGPGDLFGAAALFNDRADYAAVLTARVPSVALLFPQSQVEELLAGCPALARNYIAYLSGRIRFLERKMDGLLAGSAERRLAQYLLSRREGEAVALDCPATALAARLHVSRASLYRALDALTARALIRREGKSIRILDEKRLQAV